MAMTRRSVAELNIGELECRNRCLAGREGFKARLVAQAPHYNSKQNIGELDTKAMLSVTSLFMTSPTKLLNVIQLSLLI